MDKSKNHTEIKKFIGQIADEKYADAKETLNLVVKSKVDDRYEDALESLEENGVN